MALYQLPMLECSSCGQHLGHKYDDYYTLTKQLIEELQISNVPTGYYNTSDDDNISNFIHTYYIWYNKQTVKVPDHTPGNIISRALLRIVELDEKNLPFGSLREEDGQISIFEPRICCMRMFQSDPKMTKI